MYPIARSHRPTRPFVRDSGNRRSPEKKVTMAQEITPKLIWKKSNLPERISHRQNSMQNVMTRGNKMPCSGLLERTTEPNAGSPGGCWLGLFVSVWTFKD